MYLTKSIILLISLILFIGCDTTSNNSGSGKIKGSETPDHISELVSGVQTISIGDTLSVVFDVKDGYSYSVNISQDNYEDYWITSAIVNSSGDYNYQNDFIAGENATYTLKCYLNDLDSSYTGSITFTVDIIEFKPLGDSLNGLWFLSNQIMRFNNKSSEKTYSTSNAMKLIEINGDSIKEILFDTWDNKIDTINSITSSNNLFKKNYTLSEGKLIISTSTNLGSETYTFTKFTGNISDLSWVIQDYVVPDEFKGSWYLSSSDQKYIWMNDGVEEINIDTMMKSNSAGESYYIIKITSDSMITYLKGGIGGVEEYSSTIISNYEFLSSLNFSNGKLIGEMITFDYDPFEFLGSFHEIELSSYTGPVPPKEWVDITLPTKFKDLNIDSTYTESINAGDTVWYRISVENEQAYNVEITSGDFDTYMSIVSESDGSIGQNDDYLSLLSRVDFTAKENGFYYVAIVGFSPTDYGTFSILFSKGRGKKGNRSFIKNKHKKSLQHIISNLQK